MTPTISLNWNASFTVSAAIHAAIIGLIAMHSLVSVRPTGGIENMTIVELGGPSGVSGGLGEVQKEGRQGNAGNGGDGAKKRGTARPVEKKAQPKPEVKPSPKTLQPAPPPEKEPVRASARTADKRGKNDNIDAGLGGIAGASGTANGSAKTEGSGVGRNTGDLSGNGQFTANGDGTYTAQGAAGISYKIVTDATTKYPQEARSIGFNKIVKVKVRFLVGLDGAVEAVEILNPDIPNLGFREAAMTAIKAMRFQPIWYQGNNIKVYFRKTIVFQP
ncbi:outer membrane transport energization protein TonB [Enterobacter sp. BIGb0383]|uniref:TonB family protein n=1 Tax=unclassified Enterobacter TaxID=2608935 RepID=UPI000F475FBD|nr:MULTISPECIES: TonB family protein [unclassified Enterobacter]ROP58993.1 outer membrane transport energization protein TonB [Enterobacter sp. BIGb0383]ROS09541.1 outer membrane transport energization protein TonB [Enterobacter sp. BIGb0359]